MDNPPNRRTSMDDFMEGNETMTDEEFEKRALYDEYAEQLRRDRNVARGQGWMNDDEED